MNNEVNRFPIKDSNGNPLEGVGELQVTIPEHILKELPDNLVSKLFAHSIG
ncbi:hypothetical protein [Vibrio vulnificus]|uniref:hypothetical protein n=1 Tax=Vibrio vulnificus TaxID=672 RepID=UPI000929B948|nr:hypothetical protein [Vibrio vulnificus]OJI36657.1 hypothetical protein VVDAL79087_03621 [Vibrio vulnificus]